jgi:uracil-DNA glycosylase family 4
MAESLSPHDELCRLTHDVRAYLEALQTWGVRDVLGVQLPQPPETPQPVEPLIREPESVPGGQPLPAYPPPMTDPPGIQGTLLPAAGDGGHLSELTFERLEAVAKDCSRCRLHQTRTHVVFGVGNPRAELMFVGEAPGRDEDLQGEPFVGRAGQLLTRIIEAIGLTRAEVYLANVIKCRPPNNRNPQEDEIARCEPYLLRQIELVKPRLIVALGTFAAQTLLQTKQPISHLRGRFHTYHHVRLMPTFHPAFLLRNPERKRDVWEDMQAVQRELRQTAGEPAKGTP